jgi:hypothetical protein
MPKRNLRIVKRFANIPIRGVCEQCNSQFSVDPEDQMMEVQAAIENQFNAHKCKAEDASQAHARIVGEVTKGI